MYIRIDLYKCINVYVVGTEQEEVRIREREIESD